MQKRAAIVFAEYRECYHYFQVNNAVSTNLAAVRERIVRAAERAERDPGEIELIAVSKTQTADAIRQALASGAMAFGENKVQEAEAKIGEIGRDAAEWHLIGHLQANKARKAVKLFDVIHTLDSLDLAQRLERICEEENRERLDVLIQVDFAGEAAKSGITREKVPDLAAYLRRCVRLKLKGFMLMPPFFDDPEDARPYFRQLRQLRDAVLPEGGLSMGMSHDLEPAVEEGATMVRVGTDIFGIRRVTE